MYNKYIYSNYTYSFRDLLDIYNIHCRLLCILFLIKKYIIYITLTPEVVFVSPLIVKLPECRLS